MDSTHDVLRDAGHATPAVSPVERWDLLKQALGVDTQEEIAELSGVDLRTLQRMVQRPERSTFANVRAVCDASGIPVDILFARGAQMAEAA